MSAFRGAACRDRAGSRARMQGVTLVELVVSIVIISIAVISVLGALSAVAVRSGAGMVQQQSVAIASAYLNEVLLKPYVDPDGVDGETARDQLDDVDDFNGLVDNGAHDQSGAAIPGLSPFRVTIAVVSPGALGGVPAADIRRVDVTVSDVTGHSVALSGYRTRY